jgi:hypothetical protein
VLLATTRLILGRSTRVGGIVVRGKSYFSINLPTYFDYFDFRFPRRGMRPAGRAVSEASRRAALRIPGHEANVRIRDGALVTLLAVGIVSLPLAVYA